VNEPVTFLNNSVGQTSSIWNFDGQISYEKNPVRTFTSAGTYTIELSTSDGICGSNYTMALNVARKGSGGLTHEGQIAVKAVDDQAVVSFDLYEATPADITVYNAEGKLITSLHVISERNTEVLNLGQAHGIYIVMVQAENLNHVQKIVK
jgi:hypothetical protein